MQAVGWIGTLIVLVTYAVSVQGKRPEVFHVGNVVASGLLSAYNASIGAWANVMLNVFFGAIGALGVAIWLRAGRSRQDAAGTAEPGSSPSSVE